MEKTVVAIELASKKLKLVVGYELDGKVYPIYAYSKPYGRIIESGNILDSQKLLDAINSVKELSDPNAKVDLKITECILCLPPEGLEIFHAKERTPVISERGKISKTDIKNLYSLIKNTSKMNASKGTLIDVIPEGFVLDEDRYLKTNPEGDMARTITLAGKVQILPNELVNAFNNVMQRAGINVLRNVVSSFANAEYLSTLPNLPRSYLLVDVGSVVSSVSLIGDGALYGTKSIYWGGDNITNRIATEFGKSFGDAARIKVTYGIGESNVNFKAPIATRVNEDGSKLSYYYEDLNNIIFDELNAFVTMYRNSLNSLLEKQDRSLYDLPVVFVGAGSQLKGFADYMRRYLTKQEIRVVSPTTIGARDATFMACLGSILVASKYPSIKEEAQLRVNGVTRD